MSSRSPGFTLIELLVVLVIIGIITTFAMPSFVGSQEVTRDQDARTALRQIADAERMFRLKDDTNSYVTCGGGIAAPCSTVLGLNLNEVDWTYTVTATFPVANAFTAQADRTMGTRANRTWTVTSTNPDPVCAGADCF